MRVLCTGDLHLGRSSSGLPPHIEARTVSSAAGWKSIVDHAVAQQVDVVALSGDVVDRANRYYESLGPLEAGLRRLAAAGIPTVAVAGNHDFDVLPELTRTLAPEHFTLLGVGGRWERKRITVRDGSPLYVAGWSFAAVHCRDNPLACWDLDPVDDAPVLGLLHTDLGVAASSYAPTSLADLCARPVTMWLLGHIHVPGIRNPGGAVPVLYPGSPQAMDPGEQGVHGAWIADILPGSAPVIRQVALSSVQYASVDIDVSAAADMEEVRRILTVGVQSAARDATASCEQLAHLSLRVRVVGHTSLHRDLGPEAERLSDDLELPVGDTTVHVERVTVATRPARDLESLARGSDAASFLAKFITAVENGSGLEAFPDLRREAAAIPDMLRAAKAYRNLDGDAPEFAPEAVENELGMQATLLLDELLEQKEIGR